jgi:TPR repeat protein
MMKTGIPSPVPVVGADYLVPRQENNSQVQQNLNILSTHYVAPKTHQELLGLQVRDRRSDIYGHVFGANSSGNDDCRRRVGNAHAALLRMLDRPNLRHVQDSLTLRFNQLEQAATSGNGIRNDLATISSRGWATKFAVTKLIQGTAVMENTVELDVGINWRFKVKPRDGSEVIAHHASIGRSLNSKAFENLPLAFGGACLATKGLSLAHDWYQPTYFTSIGAKRRNIAAAAEEFRADSERAANLRAGGEAAQAIVQTYGERGRDFLESTMNEVDRSVYDYMQALQREVPRAMPPDEQFAATGVTSASQQATYARLEEARFIRAFTERGQDRNAVVEAWRPEADLPRAGVLLRATVRPQESGQSAARVRHDRSAEDPSSAIADPPRWDHKPHLSTTLAEVGRTIGNISKWGDYMRVRNVLAKARTGNAEALARLGDLCQDGQAGKDRGLAANHVAQQLYEAAAAGGHAQGQYRLGLMHARGQASGSAGGRGDRVAVQWLTQAAEQGHAQAQAELGVLHLSGRTGLDPHSAAVQGRDWCKLAVDAGVRSTELFLALGRLYDERRLDGISEEQRKHNCTTFYGDAASEGNAEAQRRLGLVHLEHLKRLKQLNDRRGQKGGLGNAADAAAADAARYLRMAVAQNDPIAAWHLAGMYGNGQVKPTDGEGTAREAIQRCLTLAADDGHAPAQFSLGALHAGRLAGVGPSEPDYAQAARRYRQAATQGNVKAQFELVKLLTEKLAPPDRGQDREAEAAHWCKLAADQDKVEAQVMLATLYETGKAGIGPGPDANRKMAEWLARAAGQGDKDIQYRLAEHYFNETPGLETGDPGRLMAAKWYGQAAAQGHTEAKYRLGTLHAQGKAGLAEGWESAKQAVALWTEAAEAEHGPAMLELARMYAQGRAATPAGQVPGEIAARWYIRAAAAGLVQAEHELNQLYAEGRSGPARPEQADETEIRSEAVGPKGVIAQEPAHDLRRPWEVNQGSAARPKGAAASTSADGSGGVRSTEAAAQKAAQEKFDHGEALAANSKVRRERDDGYRLMEEAASRGDPALQYRLAALYSQMEGGRRLAGKISTLLTQAAEQGHPTAMAMVASMCIEQKYVDSTTGSVVTGPAADLIAQGYLQKCTELGDAASMAMLGWMHEIGRAYPEYGRPDRGKAVEYYRPAAAAGNDYAMRRLSAD